MFATIPRWKTAYNTANLPVGMTSHLETASGGVVIPTGRLAVS